MDSTLAQIVRVVERAAAELLATGTTPGIAVALVRGGQPVWSGGFGLADPFTGVPMTADRLFRIASITKTFVATAIAQLRDEGRLALDDPLIRSVPEIARIGDPFGVAERVTIAQVLLHVSGLQQDDPADPGADPGLHQDELLARLGEARFVRPPLTRWHYSNLGYELLGILLARVAGESVPERLRRTVLEPAGLHETAYHPEPALAARAAIGASRMAPTSPWLRARDHDSDTMLGDGGLWSTVDDLARWIAVQCLVDPGDRRGDGPRVLDGTSLQELQLPQVLVDLDGWASAQGLGFASFRVDADAWQGHTGSLFGFRAIHLFRAAEGLGVVALTNSSDRPNPVAFAACRALIAAHRAGAAAPAPPATPIATLGTGPSGRWVNHDAGVIVNVVLDGENLLSWVGDAPTDRAVPSGLPDEWVYPAWHQHAGERVRYVRATGDRPELLQDGSWTMVRATD